MRVAPSPRLSAVVVVSALLALAACDRNRDGTTVGQKLDSAVATVEKRTDGSMAKAEQGADRALAAVKRDVNSAQVAGAKALESAASLVKDAAITSGVNAQLAKDAAFSAVKIDVDTRGGRVELSGMAPDAAARDRATLLVKDVEGVVAVDNRLSVRTQ